MNSKSRRRGWRWLAWAGMAVAALRLAAAPGPATCQRVVVSGEVSAGQEWKIGFGEGWVFRVVPIDAAKTPPGAPAYSGWDLVVDRARPAGFPDALLLATPPYDSINEREIGTTFGLRAQDAVGWNPRSFHFLVEEHALRDSQGVYRQLRAAGQASPGQAGVDARDHGTAEAKRRLMEDVHNAATGEFHILDARLVPGIADAAPFAQNWALALAATPHTFEAAAQGKATGPGEMRWMRFSVTLWLPGNWKAAGLPAVRGACPE